MALNFFTDVLLRSCRISITRRAILSSTLPRRSFNDSLFKVITSSPVASDNHVFNCATLFGFVRPVNSLASLIKRSLKAIEFDSFIYEYLIDLKAPFIYSLIQAPKIVFKVRYVIKAQSIAYITFSLNIRYTVRYELRPFNMIVFWQVAKMPGFCFSRYTRFAKEFY